MHTLALSTLLVNRARPIACNLCLLCLPLAPLSGHAFTYDVLAGSVIVQHQSTGTPLVWPTPPIGIRLELGAAGRRLLNGTTSWDDNAASALAAWTAVVPIVVLQAEALNVVRWAEAGEHLDGVVATTRKDFGVVSGRLAIVRATTILNAELCWDAYEGPLQPTLCHGQLRPLLDVRRVVLHELGHVLGLEHPDEGGQMVTAIMNHTTRDVDTLQADDEAGVRALYAPQPVAAQRQEVGVSAAGGGGCAMGTGESDVLLALVALVPLAHRLLARTRQRLRES
jgi:hypothetical protein